jgi:hypothetical protein
VTLYEWDPAKEQSNVRKHGVDFDLARRVFDDPDAVSDLDRIEGGEYRWQTIGLVNGVNILLVAYTVRDSRGDEAIRIISARPATRKEKRRYEAEIDKSQR